MIGHVGLIGCLVTERLLAAIIVAKLAIDSVSDGVGGGGGGWRWRLVEEPIGQQPLARRGDLFLGRGEGVGPQQGLCAARSAR